MTTDGDEITTAKLIAICNDLDEVLADHELPNRWTLTLHLADGDMVIAADGDGRCTTRWEPKQKG
jgi:hypothetical protein